jgi:hypothetical protein
MMTARNRDKGSAAALGIGKSGHGRFSTMSGLERALAVLDGYIPTYEEAMEPCVHKPKHARGMCANCYHRWLYWTRDRHREKAKERCRVNTRRRTRRCPELVYKEKRRCALRKEGFSPEFARERAELDCHARQIYQSRTGRSTPREALKAMNQTA